MAHLCKYHQNKLKNCSTSEIKTLWQEFVEYGQSAFERKALSQASQYFQSAIVVAEFSYSLPQTNAYAGDFLQMEYLATKHLASCLEVQGYRGKAVTLMSDMHTKLLAICTSKQANRLQIMGALGILDSSLLDLTTQLGNLSQVDKLYELIEHTDTIATHTAKRLWH